MRIEEINGNNLDEALKLVVSVFMEYEAPDYSEQGIKTFMDFINNKESIIKLKMYGAYLDDQIVGLIATRNNGNHIALFFVDGKFHRQGIGRKLFNHILPKSTGDKITVNSSPYAVEVYKRLGFIPNSEEQIAEGMRFVPMTYYK